MRSPLARRLRSLHIKPGQEKFRAMLFYRPGQDFWAELKEPLPGIYALIDDTDSSHPRMGRIQLDGTRQVSEPGEELPIE